MAPKQRGNITVTVNSTAGANAQNKQTKAGFLDSLLKKLPIILEENCPGGRTISPNEAVEKLGLKDQVKPDLICALIKNQGVPGWEIKKGAIGGIGRIGVKAEKDPSLKKAPSNKPKETQLPAADFVKAVGEILAEVLPYEGSKILKPWEVANLLPAKGFASGSPSEKAIVMALAYGLIPGFVRQAGVQAGIRRVRKNETPLYLSLIQKEEAKEASFALVKLAGPYEEKKTEVEVSATKPSEDRLLTRVHKRKKTGT